MKEVFKNSLLYYCSIPVLIGLWPLLLWLVYLPDVESKYAKELDQYAKAQVAISQILELDPDRLNYADGRSASGAFDYAVAVDSVAEVCGISSGNYELNSKPVRKKSQECQVTLKKVGLEQFAKFLSTIQIRWGNLQCTGLTLSKTKGLKDSWKVDIQFKYYY